MALVLGRVLPRFVERYPKMEVDVRVDNELVDIVAEGLDAGVRLVEAIDRDMIHVRLAGPSRVVVANAYDACLREHEDLRAVFGLL